ncbi:MAG TPA: hypothetical protein DDZ04_06215 [Parabacteroides sp.]|nr:hypothetical protein [Parabacteroides sp.]
MGRSANRRPGRIQETAAAAAQKGRNVSSGRTRRFSPLAREKIHVFMANSHSLLLILHGKKRL